MATHKPYELSEIVREYILALHIHTTQNVVEKQAPEEPALEFGQAKLRKKRKKKKRKNVFGGESLRRSLYASGRHVSDSELASCKQAASNAMQQARKRANEDVKYCCGMIRLASDKYKCTCKKNQFYVTVNQL